MSVDTNKRVAAELFERFNAKDLPGALSLLTDDANWWIVGRTEQLPAAGDHTKEQIGRLLFNMGRQLKDGLKMTVRGMIAEGDRVAVEVESHGELLNGRVYDNQYHFAFTMRDGQIAEVREYLDTQHVHATWFQE
jgi:ketosteroid isomerase-like protein